MSVIRLGFVFLSFPAAGNSRKLFHNAFVNCLPEPCDYRQSGPLAVSIYPDGQHKMIPSNILSNCPWEIESKLAVSAMVLNAFKR